MVKTISILGSTGSIGLNSLKIIDKKKNDFKINLLSANKNYKLICKQIIKYKPNIFVINNQNIFKKILKKFKSNKIKILNNFDYSNLKKKNDITISAIPGIAGLKPTIMMTSVSKKILIANKESIICGWDLIKKSANKNMTEIIPIDSEHFSIFNLMKNHNKDEIKKIYITASGGPFLKLPKKKFSKISVKKALNHPNWSMGKKITIDSATLMNKVFEVIEAKNIFDLSYNKISILTHPNSYIHAIVKFNNGLTKILAHDPDMKIPIFNSLMDEKDKTIKSKKINLKILNNLNLENVDTKKFLLVNILNKLPKKNSLFETILITVNDYFVHKFLKKEISFEKMIFLINRFVNFKKFEKYKKIRPKNVEDIYRLKNYVSSKLDSLVI